MLCPMDGTAKDSHFVAVHQRVMFPNLSLIRRFRVGQKLLAYHQWVHSSSGSSGWDEEHFCEISRLYSIFDTPQCKCSGVWQLSWCGSRDNQSGTRTGCQLVGSIECCHDGCVEQGRESWEVADHLGLDPLRSPWTSELEQWRSFCLEKRRCLRCRFLRLRAMLGCPSK